jgi:diguanylate cyclase (GGDEF)-like protein/PAS domain S-box-containing protein
VVAVVVIFTTAAGAIAILRYDAGEVGHARNLVRQIQLSAAELARLEAESASREHVSLDTSVRWSESAQNTRSVYLRMKPLAFEEIPSRKGDILRIGDLLQRYMRAVRAEFEMFQRGDPTAAKQIDQRRVEPTYVVLRAVLERTWRHLDRTEKHHNRLADVGSIIALVAALGLAGWLMRKRKLAEHAAALHELEERGLRESRERFRALLQHASDTIIVAERDGEIRNMIGSGADLLGSESETLLGTNIEALVHPDDRSLLASFVATVSGTPGKENSLQLRMSRTGQHWRHVEIFATNLLHARHLRALVFTLRDVTARKEFENQLRHHAFHDNLTKLPNRALFYDRVEQALAAERSGDRMTAILLVDLDEFDVANKVLGQTGGDELLVDVARRLTGRLSSADTAARLGADEFGILVVGQGGSSEIVALADRLLNCFEEPFDLRGRSLPIKASIGIAISTPGGSVEGLLRNADLALYAAKQDGGARYELYDRDLEDSLDLAMEDSGKRQDRHRRALRADERRQEILSVLERPGAIDTFFQPIVDIRRGFVAGYEALSRFRAEPVRPPNAWFDLAHRSGLGPRLEAEALRLALSRPGRPEGTYLSVNLSPSALASEEVQPLLPADLSDLVIEITENELVTEREGVSFALVLVRERGARLAVDDAGAGYAGLRQLMRLRPDIIKLDRSLVDGVCGDVAKTTLVDSLVRYARGIGASICAEGIETLDDLRALADLDVTYGQGYGLARPGPPWPVVAPEAAEVCRQSLEAVIRQKDAADETGRESDRNLAQLSRRIFDASRFSDLNDVMELVAAALQADEVACQVLIEDGTCLETVASHGWQPEGERYALTEFPASREALDTGAALQVLVSEPGANRSELERMVASGVKSLLKAPIAFRGQAVGMLEASSHRERPWSRREIHRARLISYQLGAVIQGFMRGGDLRSSGASHRRPFAPTGLEAIRERMKA